MNRLVVGDPMDPETVVGPVIDKGSADRIESWIEEGKKRSRVDYANTCCRKAVPSVLKSAA